MEELEQTAKLAIDSGGKGMKAQMSGWSGKAGEWRKTAAVAEADKAIDRALAPKKERLVPSRGKTNTP